uniref:Mono-/di-acylglycerol lipase N-terminal domain-containing protein n=1 Tax=Chenopodium quinoa TaxID=63459 RepID=A0A803N170_CHEQI
MSVCCCSVECVVIIGFSRWLWKRCTYVGSNDSATWPSATPDEFEPVPRLCRVILAVYEPDIRNPQFAPPGGYRLNPDWLIKRVTYEQTEGRAPPYIIYADHQHREIVLAIRGLNLIKESDYKLLLDNRLGMQMFDGGYVHHGLLKSAIWLLNRESETLKKLWVDNGRDTFIPEERKLRDPRRLYAPGRMYHIVERKFCRCGRFPPEVRTAIPVDGRFEHIVLSCNATSDHGIVWIEREAEKALLRMKDSSTETVTSPPRVQRFERLQTIEKEHKDALERAVSLKVPHAVSLEKELEKPASLEEGAVRSSEDKPTEESSRPLPRSIGERATWDELVSKLFKKSEAGEMNLHRIEGASPGSQNS